MAIECKYLPIAIKRVESFEQINLNFCCTNCWDKSKQIINNVIKIRTNKFMWFLTHSDRRQTDKNYVKQIINYIK